MMVPTDAILKIVNTSVETGVIHGMIINFAWNILEHMQFFFCFFFASKVLNSFQFQYVQV